ncbi:MAG TPA: glycosyltransferase family 4 protein, partial [Candidatus Binataceae bacterium]|nr:glycosyltransferase family 4 protein [Candidatus Binataceae bacterium]
GTRLVLARHMALALPAKVRRLANRRADAVIAVSEAARASLLRKPGIEPARLHVISNPVRFPIRAQPPPLAARIESRRSLNLPAEGRWIGFFGGGEPQKGIRDVLIAVRQLQDCRGGCHLMVCGRPAKDSRLPSVDQMAAAYGLGGVVHDMGSIEEVETAITACDVIAIATHASLSESAPLVALEAMACGTPLAAYAVGGIPELLGSPEEGGVLVAPENPEDLARQLRRLLTDTDLAMRGAMAALERARERFAPELAVDRYEALFTQLCGLPNQAHLADRPGD